MKKNCHNCQHLEYVAADPYERLMCSGFICNKRDYSTDSSESKHLDQLSDTAYLLAAKKCCETVDESQEKVELQCPRCLKSAITYKRYLGNMCRDCNDYTEGKKLEKIKR